MPKHTDPHLLLGSPSSCTLPQRISADSVSMLYHATWILLLRPYLDEASLLIISADVNTCLEHSAIANEIAIRFHRTFARRMSYATMYSAFVAMTFDVQLLRASPMQHRVDALTRLRYWLEILEEVSAE